MRILFNRNLKEATEGAVLISSASSFKVRIVDGRNELATENYCVRPSHNGK